MTARQDLKVNQGADFAHVHTALDSAGAARDLTGFTARLVAKSFLGGQAVAFLSTEPDTIDGTITLGGAAGTISLAMTAEQTSALYDNLWPRPYSADHFIYYIYDLELVSGAGAVERILEGRMPLHRGVSE